jgi:AraC-like DNA-binding protein
MTESPQIVELLLRGIAIGAVAATAVAFFRSRASFSVRVAGLLFCLSVIAYVVNSSDVLRSGPSALTLPMWMLALGGGGYFWLFVVTLFEDQRLSALTLAPAAVLTGVGGIGIVTPMPEKEWVWIIHNLVEIALALHALFVIYRSWRGDLVESRRQLRGPFVGIMALYVITLSGFEIGESMGVRAGWYSLAGASALAFFCLAGAVIFLETRSALFGVAEPPSDALPERLDPADRLTLEKLNARMGEGEAWRQEGLTIGGLATDIGIPEHRLRRLINDHLGHRNFAAFVNARRIEAAKVILADPTQVRTTVASIAFDLGFGSLGPFNRAFKEATGSTPTQWRREALEKVSPNLEISR